MFKSIKLKIIIWFLAIFSIVFAGLELFLYYELEDVAIGFVDDHMRSEVDFLASILKVEEEHGQLEYELVEISQAATGEYAEKLSGHYYQIVSSEGEVLARSPSLALADAELPILPSTKEASFQTIVGPNKEPLRVMTRTTDFSIGPLVFIAGDSLKEPYKLLGSFRRIVLFVYPVVFFVCGMGIFIITGWALAPLKKFSTEISHITEENLDERVGEEETAVELKPMASSFNTMLSRLEASFERRKQFLSDASHELRTPTSIIKSYCDVTLGRDRTPEEYRTAIRKIGDTVNRMVELINRILVISRLDAKAIELKPVRIDLKEVIKDVLRLMESSAEKREIKIHTEGGEVNIRGDREGITEVFTNLVGNAIKYNKDGGTVWIRTGREDKMASVEVEDTGIGIPGEELDKIFQRFYRVDSSRGVTVGTGLGLSIVRSIVEAHGGKIEVKSEPGKGSSFKVLLPPGS